jgi:predicted XRE-type DNA-binding protein
MARSTGLKITPSSGNVFRDLGFSREEAEHLLIRSDLMIAVQKAVARRGLKQARIDILARLGTRVRVVLSRRVAA